VTTHTTAESHVRALAGPLTALTVLALVAGSLLAVTGWRPSWSDAQASQAPQVRLAQLPVADTQARLPRAAKDTDPAAGTDGEVVHPVRMIPVFARPGRRAFAKVGPRQMGELWLPVIDRRGKWTKVLLPSRPGSAAGWVRTRDVERRTTPYEVRVHLGSRTMEVLHEGREMGTWTVAIGKSSTPTPTGRTFVLGLIQDDNQQFSDYILPLGTHSNTLDSYGGGPGTVAFHGWPDPSVFGQAVRHGCIRVPDDALARLREVPLGSLVRIDNA
jgi:lipoprotein-anchoring transpeptidase ErfK/SrfK